MDRSVEDLISDVTEWVMREHPQVFAPDFDLNSLFPNSDTEDQDNPLMDYVKDTEESGPQGQIELFGDMNNNDEEVNIGDVLSDSFINALNDDLVPLDLDSYSWPTSNNLEPLFDPDIVPDLSINEDTENVDPESLFLSTNGTNFEQKVDVNSEADSSINEDTENVDPESLLVLTSGTNLKQKVDVKSVADSIAVLLDNTEHENIKAKNTRNSIRFSISSITPPKEKNQLYSCQMCDHIFTKNCNLQAHIIQVHFGVKQFKCTMCKKSFAQKITLEHHMFIHGKEKRYQCNVCKTTFGSEFQCNKHMRIHETNEFTCPDCGRSFARKSNLKNHSLVHAKQQYMCDQCGRSFTQKCALNAHMFTHDKLSDYKCKECGKYFAQRCQLNTHMWVHTGEKPFQCVLCLKSFVRKSYLNSHMVLHNTIKPFPCNHCEKSFARKVQLQKHMKKVENVQELKFTQ